MIRFKEKLKKKRNSGRMKKSGTNRKSKEEEIPKHNRISKFFIKNWRYFSRDVDVENNLTGKDQKQ